MTKLVKPVSRETSAKIFERSEARAIIVSIEPPCRVGFRLKGTRRTEYLDADTCYRLAVEARLQDEKKQSKKSKGKRNV